MLYYLYDDSFEGLLCCVFDAFARKEIPGKIVNEKLNLPLFTDSHRVITDNNKSGRVFRALKKKISQSALDMLYICYFSEMENIEIHIFNYIRKTFQSAISIEMNFADEDVLFLSKIYKKVTHESKRMKQFVRFQKTSDGTYFAVMDPKYNVLPLCSDFFQDRYADQPWIIYDVIRNYGIYYDLNTVETVHFERFPVSILSGNINSEQQDEEEKHFQDLWNDYLKTITIKERKNLKLQRQHMPKRFWKYLTEKNRL